VRLDYPSLPRSGNAQDSYSMYFGYTDSAGGAGYDYGELSCRTLPIARVLNSQVVVSGNPCNTEQSSGPTRFRYHYTYYSYLETYLSLGRGGKGGPCPGPVYCVCP
jgi:hypothetical protein